MWRVFDDEKEFKLYFIEASDKFKAAEILFAFFNVKHDSARHICFSDDNLKQLLHLYQFTEDQLPTDLNSKKIGLFSVFCYREQQQNKSNGETCKKCKGFSPYSIPNQPDGSFICYGCRT